MHINEIEKKSWKNKEKKRINLINLPLVTWDWDKKKIDSQENDLSTNTKVKYKNIESEKCKLTLVNLINSHSR
jgi:hypothetical protein